jgi:very-short-patch-repair endonuclease/5-methylcytosine-specific restriction endonuclease McrA
MSSLHGTTLTEYERTETPERPHTCPFDGCNKSFATEPGAKVHHAIVHGESLWGVETSCAWCGSSFRIKNARLKQSDNHTCSSQCFSALRSNDEELRETWINNLPDPKDLRENVWLTCEHCESDFSVKPMRADEARFCSRACFGANRKENVDRDFGKYLEQWRSNNPEKAAELAQNPAFLEKQDAPFPEATRVAQANKSEPTSIELKLYSVLDDLGQSYTTEYSVRVPEIGLQTLIDAAVVDKNVALYADGLYWHNKEGVRERDRRISDALRQLGWVVERFDGDVLREDLDSVRSAVSDALSRAQDSDTIS